MVGLVNSVGSICWLLLWVVGLGCLFQGFVIAHDFCLYGMQSLFWLVLSVVLWLDGCFW